MSPDRGNRWHHEQSVIFSTRTFIWIWMLIRNRNLLFKIGKSTVFPTKSLYPIASSGLTAIYENVAEHSLRPRCRNGDFSPSFAGVEVQYCHAHPHVSTSASEKGCRRSVRAPILEVYYIDHAFTIQPDKGSVTAAALVHRKTFCANHRNHRAYGTASIIRRHTHLPLPCARMPLYLCPSYPRHLFTTLLANLSLRYLHDRCQVAELHYSPPSPPSDSILERLIRA